MPITVIFVQSFLPPSPLVCMHSPLKPSDLAKSFFCDQRPSLFSNSSSLHEMKKAHWTVFVTSLWVDSSSTVQRGLVMHPYPAQRATEGRISALSRQSAAILIHSILSSVLGLCSF